MSKEETPNRLYHSLTIDQFLEHWQAGAIRGLSSPRVGVFSGNSQEQTFITEKCYDGKKGTWLADDIGHIILLNYGHEKTGDGEVIADWSDIFQSLGIKGEGLIRQEYYKTRVIAELSGIPNPKRLTSGCFSHDFFYAGDIPVNYIAKVHIDQIDDAVKIQDVQRLLKASVPEQKIVLDDRFREPIYGLNKPLINE